MIDGPPAPVGALGVYLHFPFCSIRCSYCDFPTVAGRDDRIERYLAALAREIAATGEGPSGRVDSIFLGGGTPSRMTPPQIEGVLAAVRARFDVVDDTETTIECNPESLDEERVDGYGAAGVTRLSIGVQSLDPAVLERVGRAHGPREAERAVALATACAGIQVSVDLIAGLPGEPLARWDRTLETVVGWGVDHLSVYLLETDKQTPLARSIRNGRTEPLDESAMAAAYEATERTLSRHGFTQYEISNYARAGHVSRHNLKYWTDAWYAGFGQGAHAYFEGRRRANVAELDEYLRRVERDEDPCELEDGWVPRRRLEEAVILGLRTAEGPDVDGLSARYGTDVRALYADSWKRAERDGHLAWTAGRPRLTAAGRLFSNSLFAEIIGTR